MTVKRIKELWAELTRPYDDETEMEYLRKEREMLWRTVDRLEAQARAEGNRATLLEARIALLQAQAADTAQALEDIAQSLEGYMKDLEEEAAVLRLQ